MDVAGRSKLNKSKIHPHPHPTTNNSEQQRQPTNKIIPPTPTWPWRRPVQALPPPPSAAACLPTTAKLHPLPPLLPDQAYLLPTLTPPPPPPRNMSPNAPTNSYSPRFSNGSNGTKSASPRSRIECEWPCKK